MAKRKGGKCDKATYLSFVEANIARMSNYSCAIKGSCCALSIGQLVLFQQAGLDGESFPFCMLALLATVVSFSAFDCKYLQLERLNRALYRLIDEAGSGYPTDMVLPSPCSSDCTRLRDVYISWSVLGFYLVLAAICAASAALVIVC